MSLVCSNRSWTCRICSGSSRLIAKVFYKTNKAISSVSYWSMSKTYREIEHLFIKCQEFFSSFSKRYILWPSSVAVHYVGQILKVYFWNFKIFVNLCSLWNFFLRDFEISSTSSRYSSEKFSRIHQQICQPWKYSIILRTNRLASHIGCDFQHL